MRFFAAVAILVPAAIFAQDAAPDAAAAARGHAVFKSSCGFCHGEDATGNRGPDLIRSVSLSHDVNGDQLTPVIRNGRPDKGMPGFPTLSAADVSDIGVFLHRQLYDALHTNHVPADYPLAKLLTGNIDAGKSYFNGNCAACHSPTGDLAGIGKKYSPLELQQRMLYPPKAPKPTAVVTLTDGKKFEGTVVNDDEFIIGITAQDGWYHSWPRSTVRVEVHHPLAGHRALMPKYTDADIHNLFAYLQSLK